MSLRTISFERPSVRRYMSQRDKFHLGLQDF